jgi:NitT/TauT family transport system substrate-binding protein
MKLTKTIIAALAVLTVSLHAEPLKIGYSDWLGYCAFEVAKQKEWFKEAGVEVQMEFFDYGASLDAFSANKLDAVCVVSTDALVNGSNGAKSKIIALIDYSEGADMIVGKPGIESIKDLKGKSVGLEVNLVEHLLLLKALEANGMKASDVKLVKTATNDTPQTLASGKVAAVGAWYPVSGQALKQVAGSKALFTSAEAKGLIYDVLAVTPTSFAKRKGDWEKVVSVFYKTVDYIMDDKTRPDAAKIMAAKVKVDDVNEYLKSMSGCHYLTLAEAKEAYKKAEGLKSIYGSMEVGNKFNVTNKVYKVSQKPDNYLVPSVVAGLK